MPGLLLIRMGGTKRDKTFHVRITVTHPSKFVPALLPQSRCCKPQVIIWRSLCGSSVYICVKPQIPLLTWNFLFSCAFLSHEVMRKILYLVLRGKDVISELLWRSIQMGYRWVKEMVTTQDRFFKSEQSNGIFSWELWQFHLAHHKA